MRRRRSPTKLSFSPSHPFLHPNSQALTALSLPLLSPPLHPPSTPPPLLLHRLMHPRAYPHPNSLLRSSVLPIPTPLYPSIPQRHRTRSERHARCVSTPVSPSLVGLHTRRYAFPPVRRLTRVRATPAYRTPRASRTVPPPLSPPCLPSSSSTLLLVLLTPSTQTHAVGGSSGLHSPLTCLL